MFRKSTVPPERKPFSLSAQSILDDIEAVSKDDEQRAKLYHCLDGKPPVDSFNKVEVFLRNTQDLEETSELLADLVYEVEVLKKDVAESANRLRLSAAGAVR